VVVVLVVLRRIPVVDSAGIAGLIEPPINEIFLS